MENYQWERVGEKVCGDMERDQFGYSVDLSSDGLIVITGARVNEEAVMESGYARVWNFDDSSSTNEGLFVQSPILFPNPTTGELRLYPKGLKISEAKIFDINHRLVLEINVSSLRAGIYTFQYLDNGYQYSRNL